MEGPSGRGSGGLGSGPGPTSGLAIAGLVLSIVWLGVRALVLTHLVPAPAPGTEQEWLDQARAGFSGTVVPAVDLLSLDVR